MAVDTRLPVCERCGEGPFYQYFFLPGPIVLTKWITRVVDKKLDETSALVHREVQEGEKATSGAFCVACYRSIKGDGKVVMINTFSAGPRVESVRIDSSRPATWEDAKALAGDWGTAHGEQSKEHEQDIVRANWPELLQDQVVELAGKCDCMRHPREGGSTYHAHLLGKTIPWSLLENCFTSGGSFGSQGDVYWVKIGVLPEHVNWVKDSSTPVVCLYRKED